MENNKEIKALFLKEFEGDSERLQYEKKLLDAQEEITRRLEDNITDYCNKIRVHTNTAIRIILDEEPNLHQELISFFVKKPDIPYEKSESMKDVAAEKIGDVLTGSYESEIVFMGGEDYRTLWEEIRLSLGSICSLLGVTCKYECKRGNNSEKIIFRKKE